MKLVNKQGQLTQNAITFAGEMLENTYNGTVRFHGKEVRGRGCYRTLSLTRHQNALELLKLLEVHFWEDNDAPRGGKTGDRINFEAKDFMLAIANFGKGE